MFKFAALFISALLLATSANASIQERIVATIDDKAVTSYDLEQRVLLAILGSNLAFNEETKQKLRPIIIRALADEILTQKEASRQGVSVSEAELSKALETIAARNGSDISLLRTKLDSRGVSINTLREQVSGQLLWNKLLSQKVRPKIRVSDEEVLDAIEASGNSLSRDEYLISEIVMPVYSSESETQVREVAKKVYSGIRGGGSFEAFQREFSNKSQQEENAGGDRWVTQDLVDSEIAKVLSDLQDGAVSEPIRTSDSYHIIKLKSKRKQSGDSLSRITLDIEEAVFPMESKGTSDESAKKIAEIGEKTAKYTTCNDFRNAVEKIDGADVKSRTKLNYSAIDESERSRLARLSVGEKTMPFQSGDAIKVIMVCKRTLSLPEEEKNHVRSAIFNRKAELESRKYMRNIRRSSMVEIRI